MSEPASDPTPHETSNGPRDQEPAEPQGHLEPLEPQEPTEPRRRGVGLRLALYLLTTLFVLWLGSLALLLAVDGRQATEEMIRAQAEGDALGMSTVRAFWLQVATAPLVLLVTFFFARRDGRSLADLGLQLRPPVPLGLPTVAALGTVAAALVVGGWRLLAAQWAQFRVADRFPEDELESLAAWIPLDAGGVLLFFAGFLVTGLVTELMFRGFVFTVLRERLPWVHAAGISSLFFTLFQPTDDAVLAPALLNLFLVGVLCAALREATGSLWMATFFHATWNTLLSSLLSLPISGWIFPRRRPVEVEGPQWVTGGAFGPEGAWLLTAFLLPAVLAAALWLGDVDGDQARSPSPQV